MTPEKTSVFSFFDDKKVTARRTTIIYTYSIKVADFVFTIRIIRTSVKHVAFFTFAKNKFARLTLWTCALVFFGTFAAVIHFESIVFNFFYKFRRLIFIH